MATLCRRRFSHSHGCHGCRAFPLPCAFFGAFGGRWSCGIVGDLAGDPISRQIYATSREGAATCNRRVESNSGEGSPAKSRNCLRLTPAAAATSASIGPPSDPSAHHDHVVLRGPPRTPWRLLRYYHHSPWHPFFFSPSSHTAIIDIDAYANSNSEGASTIHGRRW